MSREMAYYVVCPKPKKIISQIFKISGALVFLCPFATRALNFITSCFYFFIFLFFKERYVEKTPRNIPVWQKIRKSIPPLIQFIRATVGDTVNLHVFQVRLKQIKVSSHPPSSIFPSIFSPSLIPPSPNPPSRPLGQFDY